MNRYDDHVYVLPEDRADAQLANGFVNHYSVKAPRIQVMPEAGGWRDVLKKFQDEYIQTLRQFPKARVVMLIDFDGHFDQRRVEFEQAIPDELKARVFVLGPRYTPESLKKALNKNFEDIGNALAGDCDADTTVHWDHEQLSHNEPDRHRLVQAVRAFLF